MFSSEVLLFVAIAVLLELLLVIGTIAVVLDADNLV